MYKKIPAVFFVLSAFLSTVTGCSMYDLGPDPFVIQGQKRPSPPKEPEVVYQKRRVTAPDEPDSLGPTPLSAMQTVRDENLAAQPSGSKSKDPSHMIFTGTITRLDTETRIVALKTASGKAFAFDLVNPVLRGYDKLSDIKIDDTVCLGYINDGIAIVKGETFPADLRPQTAADELVRMPPTSTKRSKNNRSNHAAPVRVKYKVNRLSFADVDNNKDGKISPVELGTVLPSLTMENFKKYDRNGDGYLDPNEYKAVRK